MTEKDTAGAGRSHKRTPRPIVCYETGEVFPSATAAAKALGFKGVSNFRVAILSHGALGGFHWYYADQPKPSPEQLKKARKHPVICWETGEEYESLSAAGRAVGVQAANIHIAIHGGGTTGGYHWYYKGDPKPEFSAFRGNKPVVCLETGRVFKNAQEAADWAETTTSGIYTALKTRKPAGGYHWYLEGSPVPNNFKDGRPVVCYETGQVFPTAQKAAEFAGVKYASTIRKALGTRKDGCRRTSGGYHWYLASDDALKKESESEE